MSYIAVPALHILNLDGIGICIVMPPCYTGVLRVVIRLFCEFAKLGSCQLVEVVYNKLKLTN